MATTTRQILEWMPMFLAARARGYEWQAACDFARVDAGVVEATKAENVRFLTAFEMIDREHVRSALFERLAKEKMIVRMLMAISDTEPEVVENALREFSGQQNAPSGAQKPPPAA